MPLDITKQEAKNIVAAIDVAIKSAKDSAEVSEAFRPLTIKLRQYIAEPEPAPEPESPAKEAQPEPKPAPVDPVDAIVGRITQRRKRRAR